MGYFNKATRETIRKRIRELSPTHSNKEIAETLAKEGVKNGVGRPAS